MRLIPLNTRPSKRQLNQFGLAWLVCFLLVAAVLSTRGATAGTCGAVLALAVVPPLIGWRLPGCMRSLYLTLTIVFYPVGFVVSHVTLIILYFLVLTPTGVLLRAFKPDLFPKRPDPKASSYWTARHRERAPQDYFKPY